MLLALIATNICQSARAQLWFDDKASGEATLTPTPIEGPKVTDFVATVKWIRVRRHFGESPGSTVSAARVNVTYQPDSSSEYSQKKVQFIFAFSEDLSKAQLAAKEISEIPSFQEAGEMIDAINRGRNVKFRDVLVVRSEGFLRPGESERFTIEKRARWDDINYCVIADIVPMPLDSESAHGMVDRSSHRDFEAKLDDQAFQDSIKDLPGKEEAYRQQRALDDSQNIASQLLKSNAKAQASEDQFINSIKAEIDETARQAQENAKQFGGQ